MCCWVFIDSHTRNRVDENKQAVVSDYDENRISFLLLLNVCMMTKCDFTIPWMMGDSYDLLRILDTNKTTIGTVLWLFFYT